MKNMFQKLETLMRILKRIKGKTPELIKIKKLKR